MRQHSGAVDPEQHPVNMLPGIRNRDGSCLLEISIEQATAVLGAKCPGHDFLRFGCGRITLFVGWRHR